MAWDEPFLKSCISAVGPGSLRSRGLAYRQGRWGGIARTKALGNEKSGNFAPPAPTIEQEQRGARFKAGAVPRSRGDGI